MSKYALKPMVETLSQALRDSRQPDPESLGQIQDLMDQVETHEQADTGTGPQ